MTEAVSSKHRDPVARQRRLRRELAVRGHVSVAELGQVLGASSATIRRDLAALEREGIAQRSYGGASTRAARPAEEALAVREHKHVEEKRVIARAALSLIKPGDTLFLNDGSTMMALARELAMAELELFVATPAVNLAHVLVDNPRLTVCLLGGFVRRNSLATGGPFAEAMIEQFNADLALLSCDAFTPSEGMSFAQAEDAAIARKMAARAKRCAAMVIHQKFAWSARLTGVSLGDIDVVVTDAMPVELARDLSRAQVEVIEARRMAMRRGADD